MIITPAVDRYLTALAPRRDRVLLAMEAQARRERIPIVGPLVGALLFQLASMIRARRVFECGSAIGYSTLWLARAVGPRGKVVYTETDPVRARQAAAYLGRAGVLGRVEIRLGDALTALRSARGDFDMVFNDVDKEGYPAVWKAASRRLGKGGLFVSDNTLWHGRVADPRVRDASTAAIRRMNAAVARDRRFVASTLPLRDGVTVAWRRA